jgi:chemotaxis-related protein WspB
MLFILFQLGRDRYALEARRVIEVLPFVELKRIPRAPAGVAGLFNYRGQPVPAVDLCELSLGRPAAERLSTRILIVHYPDATGENHLLGLVAENATEMVHKQESDFVNPGVKVDSAPFLGRVIMDNEGVIQRFYDQRLLSDSVRDLLFARTAPLSHEGR